MSDNHSAASTTNSLDWSWILYLVLVILIGMIFATALGIVKQTQERHTTYIELQKLGRELNRLKIEEQRLLIEQQTFSATPQVAQRAVTELGMFFPANDNHRVITPNAQISNAKTPKTTTSKKSDQAVSKTND